MLELDLEFCQKWKMAVFANSFPQGELWDRVFCTRIKVLSLPPCLGQKGEPGTWQTMMLPLIWEYSDMVSLSSSGWPWRKYKIDRGARGKSKARRNKSMIIGDKYKLEDNDDHAASPWSRAPTTDLWPGVCAVLGCDSDQQAGSTLERWASEDGTSIEPC